MANDASPLPPNEIEASLSRKKLRQELSNWQKRGGQPFLSLCDFNCNNCNKLQQSPQNRYLFSPDFLPTLSMILSEIREKKQTHTSHCQRLGKQLFIYQSAELKFKVHKFTPWMENCSFLLAKSGNYAYLCKRKYKVQMRQESLCNYLFL